MVAEYLNTSGLLSIDTPIEIGEDSPEEIAELIGQRYELSGAGPLPKKGD